MPAVPKRLLFAFAATGLACTASIDSDRDPPAADDGDGPPGDEGGAGGAAAGSGGSGGAIAGASGSTELAPAAVRRLTPVELKASIRDVLLGGAAFDEPFQGDGGRHDFDNQYGGLNVTLRFAEDAQNAAEKAATAFIGRLPGALPCSGTAADSAAERSCAGTLVDTYGLRLYRRPPTTEERANLLTAFTESRTKLDFKGSLGVVVEAMLQSPSFLFRTELGTEPKGGRLSLTPYELASALSYFLWRSAPDEALLDAARTGKLVTSADVGREATRMLADPRARAATRDFFGQWLEVNQIAVGLEKSDPAFTPTLKQALLDETTRFAETIAFDGAGDLASLFTSTDSFATAESARLYGVTGPRGTALEPVRLDPTRRAGFLTQPGFIAVHSSPSMPSPIFLGLFVRTKLFCQKLPPPPADVPAPSKDPNLSTRERFAMHSNSDACKGCHDSIDPIGFGFERYDIIGRYREFEVVGGKQIPLTGEGRLHDTDVDGAFVGAVELAGKLAESAQVRDCVVGQMMKFMTGRDTARPENRLGVDRQVIQGLAKGDAGVKQLLVDLVKSPAFLYRSAGGQP